MLLHRLYAPGHESPRDRAPRRAPGTCQWILSHPNYQKWITSRDSSCLLVLGRAGWGKTTIAHFIANALRCQHQPIDNRMILSEQRQESSGLLKKTVPRVLSFFCKVSEPQEGAELVLRSLLHQLLAANPRLLKYITAESKLLCGQRTAEASFLAKLLAHLAEYQHIIIIVDAVDELPGPVKDDLLLAFSHALTLSKYSEETFPEGRKIHEDNESCHPSQSCMKILITSRLETHVEPLVYPSAFKINLSEDEAAENISHVKACRGCGDKYGCILVCVKE
jgi:hypothetical protein